MKNSAFVLLLAAIVVAFDCAPIAAAPAGPTNAPKKPLPDPIPLKIEFPTSNIFKYIFLVCHCFYFGFNVSCFFFHFFDSFNKWLNSCF